MDYDVLEARWVGAYRIWIRFRDGTAGEIDLGGELWGDDFEELRDVELFRRFYIHAEAQTLVWPNGADIAPEFLHDGVRLTA